MPVAGRVRLSVERVREDGQELEGVEGRIDRAEAIVGDPVRQLQRETALTRSTLVSILREAACSAKTLRSPEAVSWISLRLRQMVDVHLCERVAYDPEIAVAVPVSRFEDRPIRSAGRRVQPVTRSIHVALPVASSAEADWLVRLDEDPLTDAVLRWPPWLTVPTPAGDARPAWAILRAGELTVIGDSGQHSAPRQRALASWCAAIDARWCSGFDRHEA